MVGWALLQLRKRFRHLSRHRWKQLAPCGRSRRKTLSWPAHHYAGTDASGEVRGDFAANESSW